MKASELCKIIEENSLENRRKKYAQQYVEDLLYKYKMEIERFCSKSYKVEHLNDDHIKLLENLGYKVTHNIFQDSPRTIGMLWWKKIVPGYREETYTISACCEEQETK